MDILEFRERVIMALRMAGLSEAQAEDEARANLVTLAAGWGCQLTVMRRVRCTVVPGGRPNHTPTLIRLRRAAALNTQ